MCLDSVCARKGWGDSHAFIPESVISSLLLFKICRYLLSYHLKAFEFEHLRVCVSMLVEVRGQLLESFFSGAVHLVF